MAMAFSFRALAFEGFYYLFGVEAETSASANRG
jgi:hypothetical protein